MSDLANGASSHSNISVCPFLAKFSLFHSIQLWGGGGGDNFVLAKKESLNEKNGMARTIVDVFKKFLFLQFREITQLHASTVYAKIVKDWNQQPIRKSDYNNNTAKLY